MQKADPLLHTKLRLPSIRQGLVPRPRLQDQVAQGMRGPLTVVTAPAGFGKTTVVASCVAGCGMPVAWLSLDKDDNQAGRFLKYLVAALQAADPALGSEMAQLLAGAQPAPPEAVLTHLINDLDTSGREMALVLDDYHFISSPAVQSATAFLLEHLPSTFHLVIATRSDPPLPLARWRARGQMVELRAADLRFTAPEAAQFLNDVMGLRLDAGSVAVLEERTEGWIAGLQMAALSMRDRKDVAGFIAGFSGTNRYILDYLVEEVLASQPPEVQRFLLCTSILKRLAAPLCDAVLAGEEGSTPGGDDRLTRSESLGLHGSASILDYLERANLFLVPLDDERAWYRYHHLFADLLQARLSQSGPGAAARLLSRAAEWCQREGQASDAVGYAIAAQDYARAGDLIARYWYVVANDGEIETVWSWLIALPETVVKHSAPLSFVCCWTHWLMGRIDSIEPHLVDAEKALDDLAAAGGLNPDYAMLPAHLAVVRSMVASEGGDYETAVSLAERARRLAPENMSPQDEMQLHGVLAVALATAYDRSGQLEKAVDAYTDMIRVSRLGRNATGVGITQVMVMVLRVLGRLRAADTACREALEYMQAQGMDRLPAAGVVHVAMSEVLIERNDLEAAEAHLSQALELGKWSGRLDAVRNAPFARSRLRLARGDANGALQAIHEAESALDEPHAHLSNAILLALRARVLTHQGALTEAAQSVEQAVRLAGRNNRGPTGVRVTLTRFRVLLAQGKLGEAVAELTRSLADAEASGWLGAALEMHILRSLALAQQGDSRAAEADLERALALGEPEGYVRIFVDEGQPLQLLLAQWLAHARSGPVRDYAIQLLHHFEAEPHEVTAAQETSPSTGGLVEPLSQRELEVLHLMALGRTNQEIARQLIVSPGTVKAHSAAIYRKLDVANRTEAVSRARQLGLLP